MTPDRSAMIAILLLNGWEPGAYVGSECLVCGNEIMWINLNNRAMRFREDQEDLGALMTKADWSEFSTQDLIKFVAEIER